LFRGRFVAGCCALRARRSWLVGIRFEGKRGHLERVEIIGSSREVLRRLLAVQLDCKKRWPRRGNQRVHVGFSHCPRRTGIRSVARRAMPAMPGFPPSDTVSVKKCLGVNAAPSRAERSAAAARPCCRQSCTLIPGYAHPQPLSHFAVHHDRPISVSSLDRRQGREKAEQEGATIVVR
jgi:hypothetical protein